MASVSHELRTPLTAVVGFARELSDHPERFEAGEFVPLARMVADQSSDVAFIIDDLLVAARAEIGRIKVLSERVDLRTEVQAATHALSGRADRIRLPEATAVARGDRLRVRQILRNLLANAVRHGGPTVTVEIVPNGSYSQRQGFQRRTRYPTRGPTTAVRTVLPWSRSIRAASVDRARPDGFSTARSPYGRGPRLPRCGDREHLPTNTSECAGQAPY